MIKSTEYLRHWTCKKCQSKYFYHSKPGSEGMEYKWSDERCTDCSALARNVGYTNITFSYLDLADFYIDSQICNLLYGAT